MPALIEVLIVKFLEDLDYYRSWHKHKCSCGRIFEHMTPPLEASEEEYHAAHNCPNCGNNVRAVYEGP